MQVFKLTLRPESAFGTPLAGDTLFGHLCWALRWRLGEAGLTALLDGYTSGRPYAVISDAFPAGLLPRPSLPSARLKLPLDPSQRKTDKRRSWLPADKAAWPLADWLASACDLDKARAGQTEVRTQNTIHRLTGTTGTGPFAPRQVERTVFAAGSTLELYAALDSGRLGPELFTQAMADIGTSGYGRDASTGLGKFTLQGTLAPQVWPVPVKARHAMTLAPCAPMPDQLDATDCFYQPLSRFGRHGSLSVLTGQPFKRPLLLMRTGAVLALREIASVSGAGWPLFHGRGLGGITQPISAAEPATVHQGYAPLLPLALPAA
jgi:CRISPR-associated protein Csm4